MNQEAKILFCEKFVRKLKNMDAQELAVRLSDILFLKDKKESMVTFVF